MLQQLTDFLNSLFKNEMNRTFAFLVTSVWIGYTLQPVPD